MIGKRSILYSVLVCLAAAISPPLAKAEPIELLYDIRPPYYVLEEDGSFGGVVGGLVDDAFARAGIEIEWVRLRFGRQLATIKSADGAVCSPGWFKNAEREEFAVFSNEVYRDRPQVVVIESNQSHRFNHETLETLIQDPDLRIGAKRGYSYGKYVDDLVFKHRPAVQKTAKSVRGLIDQMMEDRFDYTIMSGEEFDVIAAGFSPPSQPLKAITFPDVPPGNRRYLICSKATNPELLKRFNAALEHVVSER